MSLKVLLLLIPIRCDIKTIRPNTALKEKVHHLRQTPNNSEILRNAITQDDLQGVKEIVAKKSEAKNEDVLKSLSPKKDLPKENTSISSLSSSSSSEHNDKVESNKYSVCQQEKTNKSESNILAGDLTLDFSRASQNSDFLLSQKLINNVKKSTSMPTSPNDKDKGLDCLSKSDNHDFGSPQNF
ncbi:hypothetical protein Anas_04764 [Armadillidium nasatum]|uniref:Uncharacterized protein n=1 Tax=Armadillidium nasatum TaxID=96803 RepID=A0A5N5SY11_9CRUS|nr:hypothetical protein Anas_04764 [Armadillidium nasatum]